MFLKLLAVGSLMLPNLAWAQAPNPTIFDVQLDKIEQLLPVASSLSKNCEGHECGPPVCEGQLDVFRDLTNLAPILEQYVQTLNAEDAILTRGIDDAIAASDLSAAALEGARMAAMLTHTSDQALGAVIELNGIVNTIATKSNDPLSVWEFAKDINSVANRLYDSINQTGNYIESINYDPTLQSGQGTGVNLKAIEDIYIDIWSVGLNAASDLLPESVSKKTTGTKKFVKQNTSNFADVISISQEIIDHAQTIKDAGGKIDTLEEYYRRYTKDASAQTRKILDKSFKKELQKQKKVISGSAKSTKHQTALVLTQIAARAVQTYYSTEKLNAFRDRIAQLRSQALKSGDRYLKTIEERDQVRDRSRKAASLLERVRAVTNQLRECAFNNCAHEVNSIDIVILSPMLKREDGNLQYAAAQATIAPILTAITQSLSENLANQGGSNPNYPSGTKVLPLNFFESKYEANCPECERYQHDYVTASRERKYILWQLDQLDDGRQLRSLNAKRDIALHDAKELQDEYNRKTDGSYTRRLINLTDDAMQELSDIGSQIRRKTSDAKAISQQVKVINKNREQTLVLRQRTSELRTKEALAIKKLEICNAELCTKGKSLSDLKISYPSFANDEDKCDKPNVLVVDVLDAASFGCGPLMNTSPGNVINGFGIPEDSVYLNHKTGNIIPPFGPEDKVGLCIAVDFNSAKPSAEMLRDEQGRLIAVALKDINEGGSRFSNGFRSKTGDAVADTVSKLKGVRDGSDINEGFQDPSFQLPAIPSFGGGPQFVGPNSGGDNIGGEPRFIGPN